MNFLLLTTLILISSIDCKKPKQSPPPPPPPPVPTPPIQPPSILESLGILAGLAGTWVGNGFVQTTLPDFDSNPPSTGPAPFRILLHNTVETLTFTPIGGLIPNRGSITDFGSTEGQPDINLSGLTYFQRVSDIETNLPLHTETGMFLNIPATTIPPQAQTVVRMGTIAHGSPILLQSTFTATINGGPKIAVANILPFAVPGTGSLGTPETDPYFNPFEVAPTGFDNDTMQNPNLVLLAAIADQNIIQTTVFVLSTDNTGGTLNIPFLQSNANVTAVNATFWIELVENPDGSTFFQLQYTQTILLEFLDILWPHITVATLVQQ
jgi:hypothetical protein